MPGLIKEKVWVVESIRSQRELVLLCKLYIPRVRRDRVEDGLIPVRNSKDVEASPL